MRVLVSNINSTNSTLLVKLLKKINRFNVEVWGTDIFEPGYIASSTFVDRYFQAPDIEDQTAFLSFIKKLCTQHKIDFIFVSSDKEVRFMDRYRQEVNVPTVNPSSDIIALFQDKEKASIAIEKLGLGIPPIYTDLFGKCKVIFRKKCSVSNTGTYIVDLSRSTHIENHFHDGWFVQKFLEGDTYIVDMFNDCEGNPKLIVPRKKIEVQGASAFRSQLVNHKQIIETCKLIYSKFKIPGLSNIEFIENKDGLHFIEINLRIGGSATAGVIASFNYIEQYLDHFVNGKSLEKMETYMQCVAWDSVVSRFYEETIVFKN